MEVSYSSTCVKYSGVKTHHKLRDYLTAVDSAFCHPAGMMSSSSNVCQVLTQLGKQHYKVLIEQEKHKL